MDFSGGLKHWDKCKLRTALEWVLFTSSSTARLARRWKELEVIPIGLEGNRRIDLWS